MAKKFFVSLLLVCILSCSASYADIVYTTDNGTMGYIKIYSTLSVDTPVEKYSGVNDDSIAAHFYNEDGTSFIALIEPESDTSAASGDKAYIFNMSDLTKPVDNEAKILTGVYGTNSAAYSDNHRGIFFASTINGRASISQFDTDTLEFVRRISYTCSNDNAFMSTVLVDGSSVYGLINQATSQDSLFLRFDGQLDDSVKGSWNHNARYDSETIAFKDNNNVLLAHSGGVDIFSNGDFYLVVSTDTPVKALCRDNNSGFYFITQSDDGRQVLQHVKSITESPERLDSGTSESYICKAVYYDNDNKKFLAVIMNDSIAIYDPETDSLIEEFSSSKLGGIPISITGTAQNTSSTKSSSSSGCDITGSGILLILCAGYVLIRKRKY